MSLLKLLVGISATVGVGATLLAAILFRNRSTDHNMERKRPEIRPTRHHPGDPQVTRPPRPPAADE